MRGFLPILVCLALCLYYVSAAAWSNEVMDGLTCEAKCGGAKKCHGFWEYFKCQCLPKRIVDNISDSFGMPLDGPMICLYIKHVGKVSPPSYCCRGYYKNTAYAKAYTYLRAYMPKTVKNMCQKFQDKPAEMDPYHTYMCKIQKLRDNSPLWN